MRWGLPACLLVLLAPPGPARGQPAVPGGRMAAARLANPEKVREGLGLLKEYAAADGLRSVKVAVLDYGFDGAGVGRPYLPSGTTVVEHYNPDFVRRNGLGDPDFRKGFEPGNRHGRMMAQAVWAVTGGRPTGPRFYLLNANGPTMLRRAVRFAVEQRVDVILFSGTFEGGGNGDGRGPINRIVDEAVGAGVLWVNAAGNHGGQVYHGPVRILPDGYLRLRDGSDIASLRFRNQLDENAVTVTLTWNDYRDQEDAGTRKDLDLFVEDWTGRRVGSGAKVQIPGPGPAGPNESLNPRERVVLDDLPASPVIPSDPEYGYRIRVRARGGRFTTADRLRVLLTARREVYVPPGGDTPRPAVEFPDASNDGEIYPPADHPLVLTVGDTDRLSSLGPTGDGRVKPDVVLDGSRAYFTDGEVAMGSSVAAAYVAGAVAVLRGAAPALRPADLLSLAREGPTVRLPSPRGRPGHPVELHLWRTPSRARLTEVVRPARR